MSEPTEPKNEKRTDGWYRAPACGEDAWHKVGVGFRLTRDLPALPSPQNTLPPCPPEKWTWQFVRDVIVNGHSGYKKLADAHNASLAPCPIKDAGEETTELGETESLNN